jgi:hypothetical protein
LEISSLGIDKHKFVWFYSEKSGQIFSMTDSTLEKQGNISKLKELEQVQQEMLLHVMQKGFYGEGLILFKVQDGCLNHVKAAVNRVFKS